MKRSDSANGLNLNALDCRCVVGRHLMMKVGARHSADDLIEDLDHHGIAEAIVLDSLSRENHPAEGNERIMSVTRGRPRLHPAWAALPSGATDEQPEPGEFVAAMRRNKVELVYLLPGQYRYNLSDWCIDELLEPLAEARVPVMICQYEISHSSDRGDQTDWNAVVAMCKRWPTLPVIVTEWRIRRSQRLIYKALDACENLHIEMSGYFLHRGVEYITRRWGSNRLVFGSNWPDFNHGQTYAVLTRAEVSDADKRAIAGDNMRRLMAWCEPKHPAVRMKPASDAFVAMGRGGRVPAGFRIRDCHGHVGGKACHYHLPDGTLEQTVAEMDRHGVDKVCVFSFSGVFSDEKYGNDIVADVVKRCPDRFVGFTLVNPHRGQDDMRHELERCAKKGLRGVKLIPHYHGYPEAGPNIEVACRWAHERRQIVLNHDWGTAETLERFMSRYHNACYVIGHSFHFEWYMDQFRRYPNLFLCSCPLWEGPRDCERVVSAIGADRLMFGSDLQDLPIAWGLGPILFARIKPEEKKLILGDNLKQILKKYSLEP